VTPTQADEHAARLKGLLPKMTDAQIVYWAERFELYDEDVARAAVDRYVAKHDELRSPGLIGMLEAEFRRKEMGPAESHDVADEWAVIDATVKGLPPDVVARLVAEALSDPFFTPESRALLEKRGVAASKTLRGLVFERWKRQRVEAA
jgi:hypothetical protein